LKLHTPLCDELGIEYPIFSVGFGLGAPPELAAAVSNAGGCGVVGTGGGMTTEHVRPQLLRVRELTERPFGANVILVGQDDPESRPGLESRIALLIEERVPLIVFFWGDPSPYVKDAHRNGVKVFIQVGSVEEAKAAADAAEVARKADQERQRIEREKTAAIASSGTSTTRRSGSFISRFQPSAGAGCLRHATSSLDGRRLWEPDRIPTDHRPRRSGEPARTFDLARPLQARAP